MADASARPYARRGEAAFRLLLDIAGELMNQGAAALRRTTENQAAVEQAIRITLSLDLPVPEIQAATLRQQILALAEAA